MPKTVDLFSGIAIWTGGVLGLLKVVDWMLSTKQKERLTDWSSTAWLWLSYQNAGRFTALLRKRSVQIGFSITTHIAMLLVILAFLARVFWKVRVNATLELGHPRLYRFQVWIDVAALLVSAILVSFKLHPRITAWIVDSPSLKTYFSRSAKAFGVCIGAAFALLIIQFPIIGFGSPYFRLEDPVAITRAYEQMLGGRVGVIAVHAITALLSAPVMAEWLMTQFILFLSFYWLCVIWLLMISFRLAQFALLRIVEAKEGPVLGLSGILIGLGAVAKALLGK
jgi:hypothetical protein